MNRWAVAVYVSVLGPIQVRDGNRDLDLGPPQARTVFAILAVEAGRTVSTERLVDELWPARPPRTAVSTIQTQIATLRSRLGAARGRLVTAGRGYRLELAPEELDAGVVTHLVGRAGREVDPPERRRLLEQALGAWRGEPFGDLAGRSVSLAAEAARLTELRLTAQEELLAAELQAGHADRAITQLQRLTTENPFRERIAALHLQALDMAGRRTEALEAFLDIRRRFVDEYGVEPGQVLRRAHDRLLRGPDVVHEDGDPGENRVSLLPSPASTFIGREHELTIVDELIGAHRVVTLTGLGGTGKTRLAIEVATRAADRFADPVAFVDLASVTDPQLVAGTIADATGLLGTIGLGNVKSRMPELLVYGLRHREQLIVLDNCEHVAANVANVVGTIVRTCRGIRVLATSREALQIDGERVYPVEPLGLPTEDSPGSAEAMRLLVDRAHGVRANMEPVEANDPALIEICHRLDGLPLALELAASRLDHLTAAELAQLLDDRFAILVTGHRDVPDRHRALEATLEWSYRQLGPGEQRLLRELSVFSGGATHEMVHAVVSSTDRRDLMDALANLVRRSLVVADTRGDVTRFNMLETVRAYAADRLEEAGAATACRDRHLAAILGWVEAHPWEHRQFSPHVSTVLNGEMDNLRAALTWAGSTGQAERFARLLIGICGLLRIYGHVDELDERTEQLGGMIDRLDPVLAAEATICTTFARLWCHSSVDIRPERIPAVIDALPSTHHAAALGHSLLFIEAASSARTEDIEHHGREVLRIANAASCPQLEAFGWVHMADARLLLGDSTGAASACERAVSVPGWQAEHDGLYVQAWHAMSRILVGDFSTAIDLGRAAAQTPWRHYGRIAAACGWAGNGDQHRARQLLNQAADDIATLDPDNAVLEHDLLLGAAVIAFLNDEDERAASLLAATGGWFSTTFWYSLYRYTIGHLRNRMDPIRRRAAIAHGKAWTMPEALRAAFPTSDSPTSSSWAPSGVEQATAK